MKYWQISKDQLPLFSHARRWSRRHLAVTICGDSQRGNFGGDGSKSDGRIRLFIVLFFACRSPLLLPNRLAG